MRHDPGSSRVLDGSKGRDRLPVLEPVFFDHPVEEFALLGLAACQKGLSVGFLTAAALVHELMEARDEKCRRTGMTIDKNSASCVPAPTSWRRSRKTSTSPTMHLEMKQVPKQAVDRYKEPPTLLRSVTQALALEDYRDNPPTPRTA